MSQAVPYRVSAALLARQDFRAACAVRDFGAAFHLMRKYDGTSQDRICSPVEGLTQSRVSKIMRGDDRISGLDIIERLVDGLHIPGSYVGLAARDWEPSTDPSPAAPTDPSPVAPTVVVDPVTAAVGPHAREQPRAAERVERPVGLRPHLERAFGADDVTIDFAGFSGETLAGALGEPLDRVRSGELRPSTIRVRVLVPDTSRPWAFPCRIEDLDDEPAFRQRAAAIADRSLSTIIDAVAELEDLGRVAEAGAEVRVHGLAPQFKLYVINGRDAFFGFYPVTEHTVRARGDVHAMYDVMGKDAVLFQHRDDGDDSTAAAQYVAQARLWFESVWQSLAREHFREHPRG